MKRTILILFLFLIAAPGSYAIGAKNETKSLYVSPDKRTEIEANLRQARHLMEKKDYVAAKRKLERVLELEKDHAEAKTLLAQCEQMIEGQRMAELEELNNAVESGTEQALRSFIDNYPNGFYIEQAEKYLQDFHLWTAARQIGTKEAYHEYLSSSTVQGYKKEAVLAIKTIDAESAWETCKKNMTLEKLEEFIEEYAGTPFENEAKYELNLVKAERYYESGPHSTALKFYEDANKTHVLSGEYAKHFRELKTEERYEQVKRSSSVFDLIDFLSRTSSDSPYYDPISNRLAIVLANNLTISSTEQDFKEALKYAKDETIRASVKQSIDNVKTKQRDQRSQKRQAERKQKWKGKTSVGWNILDVYFGKDVIELETGLRVRFGQTDQKFNFMVGSDMQFFMITYNEEQYDPYLGYSYSYPTTDFVTKLAIPVSVRYNLSEFFYLGLGAILYPNMATDLKPCLAIEPQLGFSLVGFMDFGLNLRYIPNEYGLTRKGGVKTMVGWYWAMYF